MTPPARTIFLGTGAFAVPIVEALASLPEAELLAVVTAPPRKAGRGLVERPSPVGEWAADRGIRTLTPRRLRDPESLADVVALRPDLLLLADYGRIVPDSWLAIPRHGALNIHPSLLPRHRGAAPIPGAILAGDRETGTTLMLMDTGVDTGPILMQRSISLRGDEIAPELESRLAEVGAGLLRESLGGWLTGSLRATPQPVDGATLTRPLTREDGRLDPSRPAAQLERQVRALQPWPGSFLETQGDRLTVWLARTSDAMDADANGASPGTLVGIAEGLGLATTHGVLELVEVQRAGGRRMAGAELVRGRPAWIGERVLSPG